MACITDDACVSRGSCAVECPVGAISEGDSQYIINTDTCIDCGICVVTRLTGAISEG